MRKSLKSILGLFLICGLLTGCTQTGAGGSATSSAAGAAGSSASASSSAAASETGAAITPVVTVNTDNLYSEKNDYVLHSVYQTVGLDEASAKAYPALQDALKSYSENLLKAQKETVEAVKNDPDVAMNIKNSGMYLYDNSNVKIYRADEDAFSFY